MIKISEYNAYPHGIFSYLDCIQVYQCYLYMYMCILIRLVGHDHLECHENKTAVSFNVLRVECLYLCLNVHCTCTSAFIKAYLWLSRTGDGQLDLQHMQKIPPCNTVCLFSTELFPMLAYVHVHVCYGPLLYLHPIQNCVHTVETIKLSLDSRILKVDNIALM